MKHSAPHKFMSDIRRTLDGCAAQITFPMLIKARRMLLESGQGADRELEWDGYTITSHPMQWERFQCYLLHFPKNLDGRDLLGKFNKASWIVDDEISADQVRVQISGDEVRIVNLSTW